MSTARISRKQFAHLTDRLEEFMETPSRETDRALLDYQEEIGWPWHATHVQIVDWNDYFAREAKRQVA